MMLYGKNPVLERIKINPSSIKKLYLQKRTDLSEIVRCAKENGLDFKSVEKSVLLKITGNVHAQGVAAEIDEFVYISFAQLVNKCIEKKTILLFLDGITDPQNLGSIIRTLACLGGYSLVISKFRSATVNETVLRIASGGENYLEIAMVPNIATAVNEVREKGIKVSGAVLNGKKNLYEFIPVLPMALVIGSEGKGIRPGVMRNLDNSFYIPMKGSDISFNAAVSTAIITSEITRKVK